MLRTNAQDFQSTSFQKSFYLHPVGQSFSSITHCSLAHLTVSFGPIVFVKTNRPTWHLSSSLRAMKIVFYLNLLLEVALPAGTQEFFGGVGGSIIKKKWFGNLNMKFPKIKCNPGFREVWSYRLFRLITSICPVFHIVAFFVKQNQKKIVVYYTPLTQVYAA